jgi:DNA-binding helix-hairpin-helix protein with protein kinase domain
MNLFTLKRASTSICLGPEIGRGGEGGVFTVEGQNDRVAKIYSTQPDQRKIQKLAAMAETASPSLLRIAAWPIDLLTDSNGGVRGFVMPRIVARRDIHELYSQGVALRRFRKPIFGSWFTSAQTLLGRSRLSMNTGTFSAMSITATCSLALMAPWC